MTYSFIEKMGISSAYPTFDLDITGYDNNTVTHSELRVEINMSIRCNYMGYSDGTDINKIDFNIFKMDGDIDEHIDSITHELKIALKGTILENYYDYIIGNIIDYESESDSDSN